MASYDLFHKDTKAFVYGNQLRAAQRMLDFDYMCRKDSPSVVGIITPEQGGFEKFFWGTKEVVIHRFRSVREATAAHPEADTVVNFASERSAYACTKEMLESETIRVVAVIAEGVPERHARELRAIAKQRGKWIIGPATVGGIKAGCFRIGNTAGTLENIRACKLYRPGSVGFVAKSGGLSNEAYNIVARNTDGIYEGIAIGGDAFPGSSLLDHLIRFEQNPDVKMLVCLGELGGSEEYDIVGAMREKTITKPLVIWVTGTCAPMLGGNVQFGHAGAKADKQAEGAAEKNEALRAAGAIVPKSFDDYDQKIRETYEGLVAKGAITPAPEFDPPPVPMDYGDALKRGLVRRPANFVSTICDERGDVHNYCGVPMDEVIRQGYGIGGVIGLLWFKKKLPKYACDFIELVIQIIADHGPAVSGAHNTIVTARAGKGLIESLVSGLVTIGPRFGGAVNGAADHFRMGLNKNLGPREFVDYMKAQSINIQGIGHRLHSVDNPDARVEIMIDFARKHFPKTKVLEYALSVSDVTSRKKNNLILNVDGAIGVLFVDLLMSIGYSDQEIQKLTDMGFFNAVFLLGRSIGFMGHYFDQKRLGQPLYRHPLDDILYDVPAAPESVEG
ncbi:MAG: citrate/2-methylcitrate synthase [Polyangia bacterium]|jgi:ATP-citrate lyase alpha-subunit|nr:citrate/2-methylcitrate synthase [Polyangia bacterium]